MLNHTSYTPSVSRYDCSNEVFKINDVLRRILVFCAICILLHMPSSMHANAVSCSGVCVCMVRVLVACICKLEW